MKTGTFLTLAVAAVLILAAGVLSYYYFRLAPLPNVTLFSPKPPVPPKTCTEIQRILAASLEDGGTKNVTEDKSELSSDAIAIYQSVIENWLSNSHESLNVAVQTYPLGASPGSVALGDCALLKWNPSRKYHGGSAHVSHAYLEHH